MTHGSFICMTCSGIHREYSHRVKGIGVSSFTAEEADKLRGGNEAVNALYMARLDSVRERMRAPENNQNEQLLKAWIRRKYVDQAWYTPDPNAKDAPATSSTAGGATRVQVPSKTKAAEPVPEPALDLLDFSPASVPAPAPAANNSWDAFGGSTVQPAPQMNNGGFNASFGGQPQPQHQGSFDANFGGQQQAKPIPSQNANSNFQASFPSPSPQQQPPQPQNGFGNFSNTAQQQQTQQPQGFPANSGAPQNQQPQQQPNQNFQANFGQTNFEQPQPPPPQPQQQQNFGNFQQQPPSQPQGGFQAEFGQTTPQMPPTDVSSQQSQQGGFQPNFGLMSPQQQPKPQASLQQAQGGSFQTNFGQMTPQKPPAVAPSQQPQQGGFNANFGQMTPQQQQPQQAQGGNFQANFGQMTPQQQQGFQANFGGPPTPQTAQPQQQPPQQQGFNPSFSPEQTQPQFAPPPPPMPDFNPDVNQGSQQQVPPPAPQQQVPPPAPQQQQPVPSQQQQHSFDNQSFHSHGANNVSVSSQMMPPPQSMAPAPSGMVAQPPQPMASMPSEMVSQPPPSDMMPQPPKSAAPSMLDSEPTNKPVYHGLQNAVPEDDTRSVPSVVPVPTTPGPFDRSMSVMSAASTQKTAFDAFADLSLEKKASKKRVSTFKRGQDVMYTSNGVTTQVEVASAHHDDHLDPFYTIMLPDGHEKQTDDAHLQSMEDYEAARAAKAAFIASITADEIGVLQDMRTLTEEHKAQVLELLANLKPEPEPEPELVPEVAEPEAELQMLPEPVIVEEVDDDEEGSFSAPFQESAPPAAPPATNGSHSPSAVSGFAAKEPEAPASSFGGFQDNQGGAPVPEVDATQGQNPMFQQQQQLKQQEQFQNQPGSGDVSGGFSLPSPDLGQRPSINYEGQPQAPMSPQVQQPPQQQFREPEQCQSQQGDAGGFSMPSPDHGQGPSINAMASSQAQTQPPMPTQVHKQVEQVTQQQFHGNMGGGAGSVISELPSPTIQRPTIEAPAPPASAGFVDQGSVASHSHSQVSQQTNPTQQSGGGGFDPNMMMQMMMMMQNNPQMQQQMMSNPQQMQQMMGMMNGGGMQPQMQQQPQMQMQQPQMQQQQQPQMQQQQQPQGQHFGNSGDNANNQMMPQQPQIQQPGAQQMYANNPGFQQQQPPQQQQQGQQQFPSMQL
jgi:hypothetical protein